MNQKATRNIAIIVAAGSGSRAGSEIPKQYLPVKGKAMLRHSVEAFHAHPDIAQTIVVIGPDQQTFANEALSGLQMPIFVQGASTRQGSVYNGLIAARDMGGADNVLIHDAARPFLSDDIISRLLAALREKSGAIPALPIVDSLARGGATMAETVEREGLWRVQTPQAFHFDTIFAAHENWSGVNSPTDDARMAMAAGHDVAIIDGDESLSKYTFPSDFTGDNFTGDTGKNVMVRIGNGFDVHRLVEGEELWLCGVKIEHSHGLAGHSDADVAIHALVDAILGAAALGDIGEHFPPSDPQWRGAASDQFLVHAIGLARGKGYALSNADITIICEAPKIGPHKKAMRKRLSEILAVQEEAISVKATTTERLGFSGRGEGIAAQASVLLQKN